jgi:PAS domain S-box-containing protein
MNLRKQKILIVDDRKENLIALRKVLEDLNVDIIEAANGNDALTATLSNRFAVAILDVMMPGMDGYELAELLRGDPKTRRMPIIFLTAFSTEEERIFKGYEVGAVDYIVKPYNPAILLLKVGVFLELESSRTELAEKIQALTASEDQFRSLVATIPDIVYRIDCDGRFTFLNQAIETLGYSQDELIGEHFSRLLLPADVDRVSRRHLLPTLAGQKTGAQNAPKLFDERRTGDRITIGLEVGLVPAGSIISVATEIVSLRPAIVVEVNSSGMYASIGKGGNKMLLGTVGVIRDISSRKKTEEELSLHREHLEDLVRRKMKEQACIYAVSRLLNQEDCTLEEVPPRIVEHLSDGMQNQESTVIRLTLDGQSTSSGPFRKSYGMLSKDILVAGKTRGCIEAIRLKTETRIDNEPFIREEHELLNVIAHMISQAIERNESQEALVRSENRFRRVWDNAEAGTMLVDIESREIVDVNPVVCELLGLAREEIIGTVCHCFACPAERDSCPVLDLGQTVDRSESLLLCPDGDAIPIVKSVSRVIIDDREMLLESFLDASKLKAAEKALQLTQFAIDNAGDAIFWMGRDARFRYVNQTACQKLGYSQDELLLMTIHDIDPNFPENTWNDYWYNLKEHKSIVMESRHRTSGGHEFPVEISLSYQSFSGKEYNCAFVRDISHRKAQEEQQKLAMQILDTLNQPSDQALPVRKVLELIQKFTGIEAVAIRIRQGDDFPYSEVSGFPHSFVETESRLCARDQTGEVIRDSQGSPLLDCMCGNILCGRYDPTLPFFTDRGSFWTNSTTDLLATTSEEERQSRTRDRCNGEGYESVALVPLRSGEDIIGLLQLNDTRKDRFNRDLIHFFEELTAGIGIAIAREQAARAREKLEVQFRQSQKMETVGRLAGGVAHDFNNLLTAIIGYSEMLDAALETGSPAADDLAEIIRAAESAASLVGQLLAFSRKQLITPVVLNINTVVNELSRMLDRLIGEDVQFKFIPGEDLWSTQFDPGQLEQVLVNLAVNARDAMPDGGYLTIETGNIEIHAEQCKACGEPFSGHQILLSVTDTGIGMDDNTLNQVFEPFFTKRKGGGGTGLGLSTVHGTVHQHNGHVVVNSQSGMGTTFKVFLPRVTEQPDAMQPATPSLKAEGSETILLVEDAGTVRNLAQRILEKAGFRVIASHNGTDACSVSKTHEGVIDLLLSDVIMPEMNGRKVAEVISAQRPGTKVLFMSGYTEDVISTQGVLDDNTAFIQKPFKPVELLRKVRGVLDSSRSDRIPASTSVEEPVEDEDTLEFAEQESSLLPVTLRHELLESIELGDAAGLRSLLAEQVGPAYPKLAATCTLFLDEYAYEALSKIVTSGEEDEN